MPLRNGTVLLVEDDATIRVFLRRHLLRMHALSVVEAENGLDGLRNISNPIPDLIITDLSMPGMNGVDFITEVRKSGLRMPIIAITGAAEIMELKALSAGATVVLHKPIFRIGLMDAIAKAMGQ